MFDWNDLRYLVAVAEQGSTLKAGRSLRVSQTTVARRLAALEEALGLTLFERRSAGYALTAKHCFVMRARFPPPPNNLPRRQLLAPANSADRSG